MIPPGVDLEPHLALRRDLRRAGARARRQARAAPRFDLLAAMGGRTDPPRNRPPGLDPASQFLHDAFDGVAPGVAPLVPRSAAPPTSPRPRPTCDGIEPPARAGDACNDGGEVVGVSAWNLVQDANGDGTCESKVTCRGGNKCDCYDLERVSKDGTGVRNSCGGGVDELVAVNCSYVEEDGRGGCNCDITCLMLDGSTKSVSWYQNPRGACSDADPNEEESSLAHAAPRPCDTPAGWDDWGEAPGGGGTAPDAGDLDWGPPGGDASEAGIGAGLLAASGEAGARDWSGLGFAGCVTNYSSHTLTAYRCPETGSPAQERYVHPAFTTKGDGVDWDHVYHPELGLYFKVGSYSVYGSCAEFTNSGCIRGCACRVLGWSSMTVSGPCAACNY